MDRCACRIAFNIPGFVLFPVFLIETQFTLPIHLIKKNKILSISGNLILSLWLTKLEFTTQATSFLSSLIPYFPNGQKTRCHQFVHTYLQYKALTNSNCLNFILNIPLLKRHKKKEVLLH